LKERKMPSSKGKPTDPELREEVKEEVKGMEKGASPHPSLRFIFTVDLDFFATFYLRSRKCVSLLHSPGLIPDIVMWL
jgi:hypothetical protein